MYMYQPTMSAIGMTRHNHRHQDGCDMSVRAALATKRSTTTVAVRSNPPDMNFVKGVVVVLGVLLLLVLSVEVVWGKGEVQGLANDALIQRYINVGFTPNVNYEFQHVRH